MLRAQVQFLVRELRFAQAAWGKKKSEFLLAAKKKKKKKKPGRGRRVAEQGLCFWESGTVYFLIPTTASWYSLPCVLLFFPSDLFSDCVTQF